MKTTIISRPPPFACRHLNMDERNWREQFRQFIQQRVAISIVLPTMSAILEFEPELDVAAYEHQILGSHCQRHFLIPTES